MIQENHRLKTSVYHLQRERDELNKEIDRINKERLNDIKKLKSKLDSKQLQIDEKNERYILLEDKNGKISDDLKAEKDKNISAQKEIETLKLYVSASNVKLKDENKKI